MAVEKMAAHNAKRGCCDDVDDVMDVLMDCLSDHLHLTGLI